MDSGYDDKGLRLREGSQGNGDTDHEDTSHTTIARGDTFILNNYISYV